MKNICTWLIVVACTLCVACSGEEDKKKAQESADPSGTESASQGDEPTGGTTEPQAAESASKEEKGAADEAGSQTANAAPQEKKGATDRVQGVTPPTPPKPGDIPAPSDVAAAPADAIRTASGLASKVMQAGTGTTHPAPTDEVSVHYTGWMTNGSMFDSSVKRGKPASFPLNRVIKGWTEGLQLMVTGEKRRFWIPGELAYGNTPRGGRPHGLLVFDVELLSFETPPPPPVPPTVPENVSAAPADATTTASGLAYKVLKKGAGTVHPQATSSVEVHYSGWTKDGKMFDSSVTRGRPVTFPLNRVIKGWTEGVQLMVAGEKTRFWIPGEIAYGNTPSGGRPHGMLVFDIELLKIK